MSIPFIDLKAQYESMKTEINEAVLGVLDSTQFIMGPQVDQCEADLKAFVGCQEALAVSNGTDALQMALMALDIGPGDEVIVPGFSFFSTCETVSLVGAKPVFVDIDEATFNMDPNCVAAAITPRTKAIMPVSLYGQTADLPTINKIAEGHGLPVIEDGAQSFGAKLGDLRSCNLSVLSTTSFFPAKPLGCYGDGGAVFSNDPELTEKLKQIRIHGQTGRYEHKRIGINGRMDSLQCAVISVKLKKYDWEIEQRQRVADRYLKELEGVSGLTLPYVEKQNLSVWAQFTVRVADRSGFQSAMHEQGVPTSVHYPSPLHRQEAYGDEYKDVVLPVCEKASKEVVSLPMHPYMDEATQTRIIEAIRGWSA